MSSIININRLIDIDWYRLILIVIDYQFHRLDTPGLAVKASGEEVPPKVIFKGIHQLRIQVPPRMQVSVHKKGWMDEGLFLFLTFMKYRHFS